jgi:hypothetical protein
MSTLTMRPWVVLSAAACGLAAAALLVWPRGGERAPRLERGPAQTGPSAVAPRETGPALDAPPAEAELPEPEGLPLDEPVVSPLPEQEPPPPEPEPAAEDEPLVGSGGAPSRRLVRAALADALARHHPELERSPGEIERGADAIARMRAAREALDVLPFLPENAPRRGALLDELLEASQEFREAIGLSPEEFTQDLEAPDKIDEFDPDEPIPEPSFLEPVEPQEAP